MFGVFVYLCCSLVSVYLGASFWRAWKRGRQEAHRDFAAFFFLLAAGFVVMAVTRFTKTGNGKPSPVTQAVSDLYSCVV